jgi:hypothetical protein
MELVAVEPTTGSKGWIRLAGRVVYDDRPGTQEEYWFEVPEAHADEVSLSGDPWLLALLPLAATVGEPLRISLPVDRFLLHNVRDVLSIWNTWHHVRPVEVVARPADESPVPPGTKTGAFFSGGVDSFFAVLEDPAGALPIDDLVTVHGFDIPLHRADAFASHEAALANVARDLGKQLVSIRTNLRETRFGEVGWQALGHGPALAAAGLVLAGRYRALLIGAGADYANLIPSASHPLIVALLSTSHTRFVLAGGEPDRIRKLEHLARFDVVLASLHVCWRGRSERNCGQCEKCLRNMAILEVLGVLPRCKTFPPGGLDLDRLSRIYHDAGWHQQVYGAIRDFASEHGRADVAAAIDRSFRRSEATGRALALAGWMSRRRLLWRAGRILKQRTLARAVR